MKSIEINYLTSSGYETLYPQTSSDLVTYNSQTLTQVINQQNSDITGLQGQVGDSEVGVTIPKMVEYHFGAGSVNNASSLIIFSQNTPFPQKTYQVSFSFSNLIGAQDIDGLYIFDIEENDRIELISYNIGEFSFSYFTINCFVFGSNQISWGEPILSWISGIYDSGASTIITSSGMECVFQNNQYICKNNWALRTTAPSVSYSSLDIRIYYYDP